MPMKNEVAADTLKFDPDFLGSLQAFIVETDAIGSLFAKAF